jgi:amino acid adenylation domain-containing protein
MSDLQRRIDALSPEQRALFERTLRERRLAAAPRPVDGPTPRARNGTIPLSFAQERFWFLSQMEPDHGAYNTFIVVRVEGALDVSALTASFREIVRRHEVLRTAFDDSAGQPVAVLDAAATVDLQIVDLCDDAGPARARRLVDEEVRRGFDLRHGPFVRPVLYRLADDEQWLAVTLHHVASDRWSTTVLIHEVAVLYGAFAARRPSPLPELPIQYADFAAWQREWFESDACRIQIDYWRREFGDGVPPLQLPSDRPRGPVREFRGASVSTVMASDRLARIIAFCRQEGVTLFMTSLAAFDILLHRYSGQIDFAVGCPVANRRGAATQRLIGCFVNTLVLRCRMDAAVTSRMLVSHVRETCLAAYTHQDLPFERLVDALNPSRDGGRSPFFQVIFNVNEAHDPTSGHAVLATTLDAGGLRLTPIDVTAGHVPADLLLQLDVRPDGLACRLDYDTALFDEPTVARMLSQFGRLLDGVAATPDRPIADLPMMSEAERQTVLDLERGDRAAYPAAPVHAVFSAQARAIPDRVAISSPETHLTYGALDRRATLLARELARRGVGPDTTVALFLDRSVEFVVSMLAVLRAGGAYMPLDPSYPETRIAFMLRDAGVRTVVTETSLRARLSFWDGDLLCLDRDVFTVPVDGDAGEAWHEAGVTLDDVAYVMYTSGSTGEPKGVQIPHRGVLRLLHGVAYVDLGPDACVLQHASLSFDAATFEIWGALLHGGRLVLSPERVLTPPALGALLAAEGVTILWLTASLFNAVIDEQASALAGVRQLLIGGEALSTRHVRRALQLLPETAIVNGYGPTESTTFSCCYRIPRALPDALTAIPIGPPIANTSAYVLDDRFEPAPFGVPGALCLGGDGLARAYLRQPALTAERFVPDPFSSEPGGRLYRTGDLARLQADGTIDFLGRRDGQLKVRGFRIEAGEVEAALLAHPHVKEAAVVLRDVAPDDRRLIAYLVTADGDVPVDDLRRFLRERLPEFEVPGLFVALPAMPRTSTGKLDRRALPAPRDRAPDGPLAPPRTPLEALVLGIWQDVLETEHLGIHDNFFDRGGHSLLATRIVSRVREACGVSVPLRDFFDRPDVAGLASTIERFRAGDRDEAPPLVACTGEGEVPISFAQQRIWFLDRWDPGSSAYVVPSAIRLEGALDVEALRRSLDAVIGRHAALRTIFPSRDGQPIAIVRPAEPFVVPVEDLSELPAGDRDAIVRERQASEARRPFHLDEAPPIRARLLRLDATHHVLLVALHHIVVDGWSEVLLLRELTAGYEAAVTHRRAVVEDLPVQYGDYAAWQRAWLQGDVLERQIAYWRTQLAGVEPILRLPTSPRPATPTRAGAHQSFRLTRDLSAALATISRQHGVTLFMTLLAALQTLLARYTGQTDITIGTPVAGRLRREIEPLIGFFVNTLALRCDLSGNPRFTDLLKHVRDVTLDAYMHQDAPFERVIEAVQPARDTNRAPLFQVVLAFQNTPALRLTAPGLRISALPRKAGTPKFDLTLALAERAKSDAKRRTVFGR